MENPHNIVFPTHIEIEHCFQTHFIGQSRVTTMLQKIATDLGQKDLQANEVAQIIFNHVAVLRSDKELAVPSQYEEIISGWLEDIISPEFIAQVVSEISMLRAQQES